MQTSVFKHVIVSFLAIVGCATAQRLVTSFAGSELNFRGEGKPGRDAPLGRINSVTVDPEGRAVFPDPYYHMVFRVESDGRISIIAGNGVRGHSGDGGPARLAALNTPTGVAYDTSGNLYISDLANHRIRRVGTDGIITTFAGNGTAGFAGDGGRAINARLSSPLTIATDSRGNLFINDYSNARLRRVDSNGNIDTVAGYGRNEAGPDGNALRTSFADPESMAADAEGGLYIAELSGNRVRRLTPQGEVITIAGSGQSGFAGDGGSAAQALLSHPGGVAVERDGSVLIVDTGNYRVRRINRQGVIQTIAGNGSQGYADGTANQAGFRNPVGVAVNGAGEIFIADRDSFRVRKIASNAVSTVAGNGELQTSQDGGSAVNAPLNTPFGVAFDRDGNMLIADTEASVVRRITPSGIVRTIAGNGAKEFSGDRGPSVQAGLAGPRSANADCRGRVIIADTGNAVIRRIEQDGTLATVAGDGNSAPGFAGDGGPATQARLNQPTFALSDSNCNIYISDAGNNRVRRVDAQTGFISTVAGGGSQTGDGTATSLQLGFPVALALDQASNLYTAEIDSGRVRQLANGRLTTIAGGGSTAPSADAVTATTVRLGGPTGVALDACGRIYISDYSAQRVYAVEDGRLRVIAGDGRRGYVGDGGSAALASFNQPVGIAASEAGCTASANVYVADSQNNRIRAILPIQPTFTPTTETISLEVTSNGSQQTATLTLNSDFPGLTCEVQSSDPWLRLDTRTTALPASINLRVDPTGLAEGTVRGTVRVNCGAARTPERTVAVALNVKSAESPRMVVDSEAVNISIVAGTETVERQLAVRNAGSGSLNVVVAASTGGAGGDWLAATAPDSVTGSQAGTVGVVCRTAQLAPGTYTGTVSIQANGGDPVPVPIRLTVNPAPGKIALSHAGLTFTAVAGGGTPLAQELVVQNAGQGLMFWSAKSNTTAGGDWLRTTEASGRSSSAASSGAPTGVAVNPAGLGPGTYYGRVQVSAEGAANSPQTVSVVLNVLEPTANPGPEVQPTALTFTAQAAGNPGAQVVQIANLTDRPISYISSRTSTGGSWINVVPANATLAPREQIRLVVQPDLSSTGTGVHTGALDLRFDDGSTRRIDLMAVVPEGLYTFGEKGSRFQAGCTASRLLFQLTSGQSPIRTRAGQPLNVEARIQDDCGRAVEPGSGSSVSLDVVTGEKGGPLSYSSGGRWTRTFQARSSSPGTKVKAFVTVFSVQANNKILKDQFPVEFEIQASGGAVPLIEPGALRNAASLQAFAPVAPGMLITLKGQELGNNPGTVAESAPLPVELGTTEVRLGDRPLRLLYVSSDQVNAQVPFDITAETEHQVQVRRGEALSVPEQFVVSSAQPAIFTENQAGTGQAVAVVASTGQLGANSASPVKVGDILTVFATGLGRVSPEIEAGAPAPMDQLVTTVNPVEVTVGGVAAQVLFAGLQPGAVARYQINFAIPEGVQAGSEVPVIVRVARQSSVPVTIAVQ